VICGFQRQSSLRVANSQAGGGWFVTQRVVRQERESIMGSLTKCNPFKDWDPVRELDEFQNRLTSFFGRYRVHDGNEGMLAAEWSPSVDIIEDEKEFLLQAELPEVKKENVRVTVEDGILSIQGERKFENDQKKKRFHRSERAYGCFTRSFSLPEGADSTKVRAEFKGGLLQVHMPKTEKAKTKPIKVTVEGSGEGR